MPKTPDEIKKGLECCTMPLCAECPYDNEPSCIVKNADALALIRQLEAERDAAVAGLKSNCTCPECKYFSDEIQEPCCSCKPNDSKFEWRGVQKEES